MRFLPAKHLRSAIALVAASMVTASAYAQTAQERRWCEGQDAATPNQRIDACSAVIKAGREKGDKLADVFNDRGIGHRLNGDYDRAIADYSQAIKLNGKFAAALNNRGVSYDKKSGTTAPSRITTRRSNLCRRRKSISIAATLTSRKATTITRSTITIRR